MRYFATVSGSASENNVEEKVLASNPIMEVRTGCRKRPWKGPEKDLELCSLRFLNLISFFIVLCAWNYRSKHLQEICFGCERLAILPMYWNIKLCFVALHLLSRSRLFFPGSLCIRTCFLTLQFIYPLGSFVKSIDWMLCSLFFSPVFCFLFHWKDMTLFHSGLQRLCCFNTALVLSFCVCVFHPVESGQEGLESTLNPYATRPSPPPLPPPVIPHPVCSSSLSSSQPPLAHLANQRWAGEMNREPSFIPVMSRQPSALDAE